MIVDTSFLYALLVPNDSNHENALELFEATLRQKEAMRLPREVLPELYTAITYKIGAKEALEAMDTIRTDPAYRLLEYAEQEGVFALLQKIGKPISYVDTVVLFHALSVREGLLSFDRQMLKIRVKL